MVDFYHIMPPPFSSLHGEMSSSSEPGLLASRPSNGDSSLPKHRCLYVTALLLFILQQSWHLAAVSVPMGAREATSRVTHRNAAAEACPRLTPVR